MEIVFTVYGIETRVGLLYSLYIFLTLQPRLMSTVCAEGCEAAEKQSDDEVRISQVLA